MTAFILTCSVDLFNLQDTLSTMRLGQCAKQLKNKVKVNKEVTFDTLKTVIVDLENQLAEYKKMEKRLFEEKNLRDASNSLQKSEQEELIDILKARCERLTEERDELRAALQHIYDQSTVDQMEFVKSLEGLETHNEFLESLCKQQAEQVAESHQLSHETQLREADQQNLEVLDLQNKKLLEENKRLKAHVEMLERDQDKGIRSPASPITPIKNRDSFEHCIDHMIELESSLRLARTPSPSPKSSRVKERGGLIPDQEVPGGASHVCRRLEAANLEINQLKNECSRKKLLITSLLKGVENKNEMILRMKDNFDRKIRDLQHRLASGRHKQQSSDKRKPRTDRLLESHTPEELAPPADLLLPSEQPKPDEATQQIDLWKIQSRELSVFFKSFEKTQAVAKRFNLRNSIAAGALGESAEKNTSLLETQRNFNQSWDNMLASKDTINLRDSIFAKRKGTIKRVRGGNSGARYEISDFQAFDPLDFGQPKKS